MDDAPTLSVIVVSEGRPALLRRCVLGVHQLYHRPLELVVVADRAGLDAIADLPFAPRIRTALQEAPNISAARNAGVAMAAGEICAFLDDDAVPEPTWAGRLAAALARPGVAAATGHVLGRNGISLQWGTQAVTALAGERTLAAPGAGAQRPELAPGEALKLLGTNFAVRRDTLQSLGGFDPAYRFCFEDTDLSLRLAQAGLAAVAVPGAVVHHGYAASRRRRADRAPLSLVEIAASQEVFLRKFTPAGARDAVRTDFREGQMARIDRFAGAGLISAGDAARLKAELEAGRAAGATRQIGRKAAIGPAGPFEALRGDAPPPPATLAGRRFQARGKLAQAEEMARGGGVVSLFLFEPTIRAHRVAFTDGGVWLQRGGLFGPSDRGQARARFWRFSRRVAAESARVDAVRAPD